MKNNDDTSKSALVALITAKKAMEHEYDVNLEELKKWDAKIKLADRHGKIELGNKALERHNFYARLVSEIKQHIEQIERQINTAKEKISIQSNPYNAFERMEKKVLEMQRKSDEVGEIPEESAWDSSFILKPDSNKVLLLSQSISKAINEVNTNINQADKQYKIIKSQYSEYEKKAESFHVQAVEFMTKGETNAATIALSSEATTKNLLDSLSIQLDNQKSLINMFKKHLMILERLKNFSNFDIEEDSIVDFELEILKKKLNEL
jgi:phage shock protein A